MLVSVIGAAICANPVFAGRGGKDGSVAGVSPAPQPRAGEPLVGLTQTQLDEFFAGKADYNSDVTIAEGLGPIFNKSSCGNCHNSPIGGWGTQVVTRFGLVGDKGGFDPLGHLGGSLLQALAIDEACLETIPPEANVTTQRVTNSVLAFGLVEAIPDAALLANETSPPGGVSGRAHMVAAFEDPIGAPLRVGRFGWKAQVATTLTFSADAAQNELGLSNRFIPFDNAPNGDAGLLALCDSVADPEDGPDGQGNHFIDRVTHFQRRLGPPPQTPRSGMSGETIFNNIGCANCHVASFTTSNDPGLEDAIRNKVIRPYSDFLLHDMGLLGDGIVQGDAQEREIKTPPLWGLRIRQAMLHDSRVVGDTFENRIQAVVNWHNAAFSEAQPSAIAFNALSSPDKAKVVAFLDSLGKLEFDSNGDESIDLADFNAFRACYAGGPYNADHACAVSDVDQDGDTDLTDFGTFLVVWQGLRKDCNSNGVMDLTDILTGVALDADFDGIPDGCEPTCDRDTNGDGNVGIADLLAVIGAWGPCQPVPAPCGADLNGDDIVGIADLLSAIGGWGACP